MEERIPGMQVWIWKHDDGVTAVYKNESEEVLHEVLYMLDWRDSNLRLTSQAE
jgi:hypothetical protein